MSFTCFQMLKNWLYTPVHIPSHANHAWTVTLTFSAKLSNSFQLVCQWQQNDWKQARFKAEICIAKNGGNNHWINQLKPIEPDTENWEWMSPKSGSILLMRGSIWTEKYELVPTSANKCEQLIAALKPWHHMQSGLVMQSALRNWLVGLWTLGLLQNILQQRDIPISQSRHLVMHCKLLF